MATVTINQLSLLEIAKRVHNGRFEPIAETLKQTNDMWNDAVWLPANDMTSHVFTRQQKLPTGSYKKPRVGTAVEGGKTNQIREEIAELYGQSEVDLQELDKAPDRAAARMSEDTLFIEGMSQTAASDIIYGNNGTDPEKINGFANRDEWSSIGTYVINQGGTGSDLSSLWIIHWGDNAVSLRYPMNQQIGLQWNDNGKQRVTDSNSNPYYAMCSEFIISYALVIKDPRNVQRLANIETAGSSNTLDDDNIIRMLNKMVNRGKMGTAMYCNRTIMSQLDIIGKDQNNINYVPSEFGGRPTMFYRMTPVGLHEQILDTESALS